MLFTAFSLSVYSQAIRVSVIVPNPPPAYWDAYLEFNADIRVILTNVSTQTRELKLIPTLTSDRGLGASFSPDFQPLSPIVVPGGGTVNLTYRDLRAIFGTPAQSDVQLSGISFDRLFESETIPEGTYTLCVEARDFTTSEPLSNNFGCDVFFLQQHEPPLIIYPSDGAQVTGTQPQFINFLWSTTGIPGRVRYRFELYDLDDLGLNNPADAFLLAATRPLFETDELVANTLAYDLGYPPLIPGRHYAIQVTAYDPNEELLFAQGGQSQVHQFQYAAPFVFDGGNGSIVISPPNDIDGGGGGGGGGGIPGPGNLINQGNQQANYVYNCPPLSAPTTTPYPNTIGIGQTVSVGGFPMEILSGGGYSPIAGTGRILVPAFSTYVNVEFTGLDVNTNLEAYGNGDVVRAVAGSNLIPNSLFQDLSNGEFNPNDLAESTAGQLRDYVANNNNWLNPQNPGIHPALSLPAGVAGAGMDLILTGMEFTPVGGVMAAYVQVDLPEAQGDRRLLFIGKGICLTEGNLGQGGALVLGGDQTFALSDGLDLTFLGGEDGTSVDWSENGVTSLNVSGRLSFDQTLVKTNGQALTASFTATVEDYQDWTATVTLNQNEWAIPGLEDFALQLLPGTIAYDHSSVSAPPGFDLPASHPMAGNEELWQGVYIPGLEFSFPSGIDAEVNIEDIILDQQGVWLDVDVNGNILSFGDNADVGNWPLAIDHLGLDVRGSSVESASFGGRIKLPISSTELAFTAPIGGGGDFNFAVELGQAINVEMWVAEMSLAGNSAVGVSKQGNSYLPQAVLHGEVSIGWTKGDNQANSAVGDFELPGIEFQDLTITGGAGQPQLSGQFGLDLEDVFQGGLAAFPLQLKGVDLNLNGSEIGLQLELGLKLTEMANGFEGSTAFTIIGDWDGGQKRFSYDRTELNQISIEADMGVIAIDGSIVFYNGDPTYGDGFDGAVDININPLDIGLEMRLMVGKKPGYRYFMIDALAKFPGIPLGPSGLGLYGLGGGFYANMQRQFPENQIMTINDVPDVPELGNVLGEGGSGATYVPLEGNFGFMARAVLGLFPVSTAMNADLQFGMDIGPSFNVNSMYMSGDAYVMQNMADRDGGALISGGADLLMNFQDREYTFGGSLHANILKFLELDVSLEAYYSPDDWHFYLGRWTPGHADPLTDPNRIKFEAGFDFAVASVKTGINSYFMMGTDLPAGLPPKPLQIQNIFAQDNDNLPSQGLLPVLTTMKGFAFGMINYFDLSFKVLIFRLDIEYLMGLDILMENKQGQECSLTSFGINQWYGKGQAYAYLGIEGAVEGRLFGKTRKFTFIELEAAASIDFAGPKPIWLRGKAALRGEVLGGLVKFDTQVQFEHGQKVVCSLDGNNVFDDIPIVEEFDPADGATLQSIFTNPQVSFNFPRGVFPIEEESDEPGETLTRYYGYQITSFKVRTKVQGENWKVHAGGTGSPQYDNEGYSCAYDLPEQLPEYADVEIEIKVRGRRYGSNSINDVAENFDEQVYKSTFKTGEAPDYILANSIDQSVPFHRQRYFLEDQHGANGYFNFWHEQSNKLFRTTPSAHDGLSNQGTYSYKVRFKDLAAGTHHDVNPTGISTAAGGGLNFALPKAYLQPNKVYEIDVVRIYNPPAGNSQDNTNVVMEDLGIDGQGGGGGGGGGGQLQILALPPPPNPNQGLFQVAILNNNNNGGGIQQMGLNNQFQVANNPPNNPNPGNLQGNGGGGGGGIQPGPGNVQGNGGGGGGIQPGPGNLLNPGGNMDGLKYASRRLKHRGQVGEQVVKSLMQQKFYFKTSKYTTLAAKMADVDIKNLANTKYQEHILDTDPLHQYPDGAVIKTPYVFLESEEPFDRFESQYWTWAQNVTDGANHNEFKATKYSPYVTFEGEEDWRSQTFMTESNNGLFRPPFDYSDNSWCNHTFYDPDSPYQDFENALPKPNAILHTGSPNPWKWFVYQQASPDAWDLEDNRRYRHEAPFGTRKNRELPPIAPSVAYDYELPTMEFLQHAMGNLPNSLNGVAVQEIHTYLNDAEVNNALPPPANPGGFNVGNLVVNNTPPNGGGGLGTVIPNFQITLNGGIQGSPSGGGGGFPGGGGPGIYQAGPSFIPLVDFTEWMTFQDYILFRRLVDEGVTELAILSETFESPNSPHFNLNIECDAPPGPLPNDPNYNNFDPPYDFYLQYYKQIRAYFKMGGENYFPYPHRPAQDGYFTLGGKQFYFQTPLLNQGQ